MTLLLKFAYIIVSGFTMSEQLLMTFLTLRDSYDPSCVCVGSGDIPKHLQKFESPWTPRLRKAKVSKKTKVR